jgi:hypothetical protein
MPFSRDLASANAAGRMITSEGHPFFEVVRHLTDVLFSAELWEAARQALSAARAAIESDLHGRSGAQLRGGSA